MAIDDSNMRTRLVWSQMAYVRMKMMTSASIIRSREHSHRERKGILSEHATELIPRTTYGTPENRPISVLRNRIRCQLLSRIEFEGDVHGNAGRCEKGLD